jgi:hypothetical protein
MALADTAQSTMRTVQITTAQVAFRQRGMNRMYSPLGIRTKPLRGGRSRTPSMSVGESAISPSAHISTVGWTGFGGAD